MNDKCNYCGKKINKESIEDHMERCKDNPDLNNNETINKLSKRNEVCNDIVEALKALMIDTIENERKRESQKAFKRKVTNDLETILKYNTNYELHELMDILNIKYKSSDKKQILINRIKVNYISVVNNIFKYINNTCYKDLKFLYKNKGIIKRFDIDKIQCKSFLQDIGVLYPSSDEKGEFCLSSPAEVLELIKNINKNEINNNSKIISFFKGCIYYYGVISIEKFMEVLDENLLGYRDISDIQKIIELHSELENTYTYVNGTGMHLAINDEFEIIEIIDNSITEYKKLTDLQLINASVNHYTGEYKLYNSLRDIIYTCYDIEKEDLEEILKIIYITLQLEGIEGAINFIHNEFEIPNVIENEIKEAVEYIYNKLPLWKYKGYSKEELCSTIKSKWKNIKVSRNEKCPCGSGKKYKHCCGSNIIEIG